MGGVWQLLLVGFLVLALAAAPRGVRSQGVLAPCVHNPQARCFDETCGEPLYDEHVGVPCICNEDDIGYRFTDCINGSRSLFYYWRPPAVCQSGTLPPPVYGLACDTTSCLEGQFRNLSGAGTCEICPPGHTSDPLGVTFDSFLEWPAQLRTYCAIGDQRQQCSVWELGPEFVNSGDNSNLNYLRSKMELRVNLVRPGRVSFEYRVSAEERFDGLWFIVDDLIWLSVSNTYPQSSWKTFTRQLSAGPHVISWDYHKDRSISGGEDRAFVRRIDVDGIRHDAVTCHECPPGHYGKATGNQRMCTMCPEMTFNPNYGGECQNCPAGQTSHQGATECVVQYDCTQAFDATWEWKVIPNNNTHRMREWKWIVPATCDPATRPALPATVALPYVRTLCSEGMKPSPTNSDECVYCEPGTISESGLSCTECPAGTATLERHVSFTHFATPWSSPWSTGCEGDNCAQASGAVMGWRAAGHFMDSGGGHGVYSEPWVKYEVNAFAGFHLYFHMQMWCGVGNHAVVSVNGVQELFLDCTGESGTSNTDLSGLREYKVALGEFNHTAGWVHNLYTIEWRYQIGNVDIQNRVHGADRLVIRNVTVNGVWGTSQEAGAHRCIACPRGTANGQPKQAYCPPCPAGSFAGVRGSQQCLDCPAGSISHVDGSEECFTCGSGTKANQPQTDCMFSCTNLTFSVPGIGSMARSWDLSSIAALNLTDMIDSVQDVNESLFYSLHLSLCERDSECSDIGLATYACLVNHTRAISKDERAFTQLDFGRNIHFHPDSSAGSYINITFDGGSDIPIGDSAHNTTRCSANIHLMCDPSTMQNMPTIRELSLPNGADGEAASKTCYLELEWGHQAGCSMCKHSDFTRLDSECDVSSKTRKVVHVQHNANCFGGYRPMDGTEACEPEVTVKQTTGAGAIVVIVLILVAVAITIGVLIYKNRKITNEYAALQESHIPMHDDDDVFVDRSESASEISDPDAPESLDDSASGS